MKVENWQKRPKFQRKVLTTPEPLFILERNKVLENHATTNVYLLAQCFVLEIYVTSCFGIQPITVSLTF